MSKLKSLNFSKLFSILKCCLIGILASLVGIILFALILQFVDLSDNFVSYAYNAIKGVSIFAMIFCLNRADKEKLLIRSIIAAIIYALLSWIIFSIFNSSVAINLSILYDLLFALIVALVSAIIVNLFVRKN